MLFNPIQIIHPTLKNKKMNFVINAEQLRAALKDIEVAEKKGFKFCEAVFKLTEAGESLSDCKAKYSDLIEKAHPTNGNYNWGRFQNVTKKNKFKRNKLVPIS